MYKSIKDGISVFTILDTRRAKRDGKYPVKVQVSYRRIQKYYSTGKSLTVEEWEALPTTKSRAYGKMRSDIEQSYDNVLKAVENLIKMRQFSFDGLNLRLKKANTESINTAFRAKMADLKAEGRIGSMIYYDNVLKGIERFGGTKIGFDSISIDWIKRYDKFLKDEAKTQTTVAMHMRALRAILNDAKRAGIINEAQYPFGRGRYEIRNGEGRKLALTLQQIGQIARYEDGSETTEKYRDYWLFIYLCNGINIADFVKLKYKNIVNNEIYYIRQKTEHTSKTVKEIRVPVTDPMNVIIDKWGDPRNPENYIFPILDGKEDAVALKNKTNYLTSAINKRMREIGESLGLGNISTYTARHSFATVLKRSGANIAYISESLGHTDLKTTENYLASFEKEERERNANLLTQF